MTKTHTLKALVVADKAGNILAGFVPSFHEGNPPEVKITPLDGQTVHEVEMPDELTRVDAAADVFGEYRLQVKGAEARLVRRSKSN